MSNYATKRELNQSRRANTSNLSAKRDFIALKADVHKLGINKLLYVPIYLNNLKTKLDDLHLEKLKTVKN